MDDGLKYSIYERLRDDEVLSTDWSSLVIAACEGEEELAAMLDEPANEVPEPPAPKPAESRRGAFVSSLSAQGFRGIGSEVTLGLEPGPGLTLVVGRNGSGKSSFAEALEVLLTGDSKRWSDRRQKAWKEGWRNLHKSHPTFVAADFLIEGASGKTSVERAWEADAELAEGETTLRRGGTTKKSLDDLGWGEDLATFRPFLSYNELGSMLEEGPAKLYDALSVVLGLDELVAAQQLLAARRSEIEKAVRNSKAQLQLLLPDLKEFAAESGDERPGRSLAAVSSKTWDLDALEAAVAGEDAPGESELELLRSLAALPRPEAAAVASAVKDLRAAAERMESLAGTDAVRAMELAALLTDALAFHAAHDERDCPVCGAKSVLGEEWRSRTEAELARLREEARGAQEAQAAVTEAVRRAKQVFAPLPVDLTKAAGVGVGAGDLIGHGKAWLSPSDEDPKALALHLETNVEVVIASIEEVRKRASAELARREDAWRPLAHALIEWLGPAREALARSASVKLLKDAEAWLRKTGDDIRNERFEPVAKQAIATWDLLKQQSNVQLGAVALAGTKTSRRVELEVTVDGVSGVALGVMSQGELHSLALSLFLPRVMLVESPFRFVVIDDPVQSMDPARIDGLARVLEEVAQTRQVVVLTHDDRLPEAVRRLRIPARMIQVTRRLHSSVELKPVLDPVTASIEDGLAVAHTKELPDHVAGRVVPGFCRSALEAAFIDVVRRRKLGAGIERDELEQLLSGARKLTEIAALALFDDASRGGDVMTRLNKIGGWAGDVFKDCNKGTHQAFGGSLINLCEDTRKLSKRILELS